MNTFDFYSFEVTSPTVRPLTKAGIARDSIECTVNWNNGRRYPTRTYTAKLGFINATDGKNAVTKKHAYLSSQYPTLDIHVRYWARD